MYLRLFLLLTVIKKKNNEKMKKINQKKKKDPKKEMQGFCLLQWTQVFDHRLQCWRHSSIFLNNIYIRNSLMLPCENWSRAINTGSTGFLLDIWNRCQSCLFAYLLLSLKHYSLYLRVNFLTWFVSSVSWKKKTKKTNEKNKWWRLHRER